MNKNILEISPWIRAEDIVVFGDPHGQIDAVKELITSFGACFDGDRMVDTNGKTFICVGDWFNKGGAPLRTLSFVLQNHEILSVRGNHERFMARYIGGELDSNENTKQVLPKFDSAEMFRKLLQSDDESDKKIAMSFLDWYEELPYMIKVHFENQSGIVYITHSPVCKSDYLETPQDDMEKSLSRMCNFRIEDRDNQNFREICTIPFDECNNLYEDYVIFGHLAFKVPFIHRRYIGIDTGAVYGNMLSAVFFERGGPKIKSIKVSPVTVHKTDYIPILYQ